MFRRIQETARILRAPLVRQTEPQPPFRPIPSRAEGLQATGAKNPATRVLELTVMVAIITWGIEPLIHKVFGIGPGTSMVVAVSTGVILGNARQAIERFLAQHLNLSVLDPYVGRKLRDTKRTLKS